MKTSRRDDSRCIDYSGVRNGSALLVTAIIRYVRGPKKDRRNPVSRADVLRWFNGTARDFVEYHIDAVVAGGAILLAPTERGGSSYVVSPLGDDILKGLAVFNPVASRFPVVPIRKGVEIAVMDALLSSSLQRIAEFSIIDFQDKPYVASSRVLNREEAWELFTWYHGFAAGWDAAQKEQNNGEA